MKKINIGCGNIPLEGYINIDPHYYPGTRNLLVDKKLAEMWNTDHSDSPWTYGDARTLSWLDDSFDEIICVHALEHLDMDDGNQAIKKMYRILKPGGFIEIEVPDLIKACKLAQEVHIEEYSKWLRVMGLFNGTTGGEREGQYHLCMYTKEALQLRLEQAGFKDVVEIEVGFGHGKPEPQYDFRLKGFK